MFTNILDCFLRLYSKCDSEKRAFVLYEKEPLCVGDIIPGAISTADADADRDEGRSEADYCNTKANQLFFFQTGIFCVNLMNLILRQLQHTREFPGIFHAWRPTKTTLKSSVIYFQAMVSNICRYL